MWEYTKWRKYRRLGGVVVANCPDTMASAHHTQSSSGRGTYQACAWFNKAFLHRCLIMLLVILALLAGEARASRTCPAPPICTCESQDGNYIINCRMKSLTTVPTWTNGSTLNFYELTLAHNQISTLERDTFNGLNIKRLDLTDNPIMSVDAGAFNGLESNLEELVLHVKNMDQFPKEALAPLVNLRLLTINGLIIPLLPENAMATLTQLRDVKLEKCGLEEIGAQDLAPFRDSLHRLSLPYNYLTEVPSAALSQLNSLEHLDLQHNKLRVLEEGFLSQSSRSRISSLDFSNNEIAAIKPDAFSGLELSLKTLVLKSNKLTDHQLIPLGALTNLESLNLAINSITNVDPSALSSMNELHTLNLQANNLNALTRAPLEPVRNSLQFLDVSHNYITSIESGMFQGFSVLREMHMDNQYSVLTDELTETSFQGLEGSLKRLSLGNVGFTTANLPSVKNLGQLEFLSLKDNSIRSVPRMSFQHLANLVTLDLSNNSLSSLSQGAMYGMQRSLVEINLVSNQLETLSECVFKEYRAINRIKLGKNPLRCDCDLVWLRQWIAQFEIIIEFLLIDWKCQSPSGVQDRQFKDLSEEDLCDRVPDPESCEVLTLSTTRLPFPSGGASIPITTTTTTTTTTSSGTSEPFFLINKTELAHDSVLLSWEVKDSRITQFKIETNNKDGVQHPVPVLVEARERQYRLENLLPATKYVTCITSLYSDRDLDKKSCTDFQTLEKARELAQAGPSVGVIVGAVVGALAFLALLIILGFLVVRSRSGGDTWLSKLKLGSGGHAGNTKKWRAPTGIPQIGYNSRRFSRPRGATASTTSSQLQNDRNLELEKKLAGFSDEERDRILNMLTTTGGSTASIISTGSSTRYVPELPPRPQSMEGYLNPQKVRDEFDDPEYHIYSEIPAAAQAGYEEPRSSMRDSGISTASGKYQPYPDPMRPPSGDCYI